MTNRRTINYLYLANSAAWLLTAVLWYAFWYFNPYSSRLEMPGPTVALFGISLLAQFFCYTKRPGALIGLATASFFPFGLYLLGTLGIFAWIGITNIVSLVLAIVTRLVSERKSVLNGN